MKNCSPRTGLRRLAHVLGISLAILATGCTRDARDAAVQRDAPRAAQPSPASAAPAPAPAPAAEPAPTPPPAPAPAAEPAPVLKDLAEKIRPPVPPAPPADPGKGEEEAIEAAAAARKLAASIDAGGEAEARALLVDENDLDLVATDGLRDILAANLLPANRKTLDAILAESKGIEVKLVSWAPGTVSRTKAGSLYKKDTAMMTGGKLVISLGEKQESVALDLIRIEGTWKVFKLTRSGG